MNGLVRTLRIFGVVWIGVDALWTLASLVWHLVMVAPTVLEGWWDLIGSTGYMAVVGFILLALPGIGALLWADRIQKKRGEPSFFS